MARILSYSGLHFPSFGLNKGRYFVSVQMQENADQSKSEYGHFLRSDIVLKPIFEEN